MVKRIFFFFCFMFPLLTFAQKDYLIKNVKGNVTLRRINGGGWIRAKPPMYVALEDTINVRKGGSVTIEEIKTKTAFPSEELGKMTVFDRAINSAKEKKTLFARLNYKYFKKRNTEERNYVVSGVVTRNRDAGDTDIQGDLYDSIYADIMRFYRSNCESSLQDIDIKEIKKRNGTFSILIENNSDRLLYFNVVHVTNGHPTICYYFDDMDFIPLQSGAIVDLTMFPLFQDQGQFILIASEINLSVELLEVTFESEPILSSCELESIKLKKL